MIMPASSAANPAPRRRRPVQTDDFNPAVLYSEPAEKAVLGCMMAQPHEVVDAAVEALTKESFFIPAHQEIFAAISEMYNASKAIDVMTIHQWLVDHKLDEAVGSPGILAELLVGFATHMNVGSYIEIVRNKGLLRSLQHACSEIVQDIMEMPDSVPAVLDRAEAAITKITQAPTNASDSTPSVVVMNRLIERITNYDGRAPVTGIHTGFVKLNEYTGGWKPGDMIVLAARPGVGKTSLALAFLHAAVKNRWSDEHDTWIQPGVPAGFISIEMPHEQITMRRLAMKASIPLNLVQRGLTEEHDRNGARLAAAEMQDWPLVVRDPSSLTITQARSKARRMKSEHGIQLLVIDYLQLITSPSKSGRENRQNEVAEISRGIKSLAMELKIPIIILAQLNRKTEEGGRSKPGIHNLRESGAIEQDADIVLLLSEDLPDGEEQSKSSPVIAVTADIAKQRNGPSGPVPLLFHRRYTRFDEPISK